MNDYFTAFESLEALADEGGKYYRLGERPSDEALKGGLAYVLSPGRGLTDVLTIKESDLQAEVELDFFNGDWESAVAALDRAGFATRALDLVSELTGEMSYLCDGESGYDGQSTEEAVLKATLKDREDEPEACVQALCELDGLELVGYATV